MLPGCLHLIGQNDSFFAAIKNKSRSDTTKPAGPPGPLLPKLSISIVQGLIGIYGRLQGELNNAQAGRQILIDASHPKDLMKPIAGLMPLFGIDFDPAAVKTVRTRVDHWCTRKCSF